jgi:hypothetical protein
LSAATQITSWILSNKLGFFKRRKFGTDFHDRQSCTLTLQGVQTPEFLYVDSQKIGILSPGIILFISCVRFMV